MGNWFKSLTRTDGLAIAALLISCISAWFSYQQYQDSVISRKTPIIIRASPDHSKIVFYKPHKNSPNVLFKQRYKIILTNNSFNPESVIDWRFWELRGEKGGGWYAGMNFPMVDQSGASITLPLLISAKESKTFYLDIGQKIPIAVWEAVGADVKMDTEMDWYAADKIFSDAGHPFFGQLSPGASSAYQDLQVQRWGAGPSYQEYKVVFSKADGQSITAKVSLAVSDNPQGEATR